MTPSRAAARRPQPSIEPRPIPSSRTARDAITRGLPLVVAAVTILVFLPALRAGFVAWDDDKNFLSNPHYRGLGLTHLRWMWTTFHLGHYVPLTWMTLGADYLIWGMNPVGYHLTNLLFHTANAVLLYFLARRVLVLAGAAPSGLSSRRLGVAAALAALLFSIHPLRVESVAWVTERRDVLSGFFYLLSIFLYLRAVDDDARRRRWYSLALVAFGCALLSKATAMSLPAVLLILNVYPLRRLGGEWRRWTTRTRRVYLQLAPFAVLAAAAAALSLIALHPPAQLGIPAKLAVSAYSLAFYVWKTLVPVRLSPVYEMPQHVDPLAPPFLISYGVVIGLTGFAWVARARWPGALAAWLAFVVVTLPMLGIIQNGPQIAADRYTYHAAPALAILGAGVCANFGQLGFRRIAARAIGAAILVLMSVLTWRQTYVWHDSASLWTQVLRLDDASAIGHTGMANVLFKEGAIDEATAHAERAVSLAPGYAQAHNDLGVGLARQGHFDEAVAEYQRALAIDPSYDEPRGNWGVVLAGKGDLRSAIALYQQALAANPDNADTHVNWGNALVRLGRPDEAIGHYREALRIRPNHADAEHNWGVALARQGKLAEAIEHFRRALAIEPGHAEAKDYLEKATRLLERRR